MVIDHLAYPHIIDMILSHGNALRSFRRTSRFYLQRVDIILYGHIAVFKLDQYPLQRPRLLVCSVGPASGVPLHPPLLDFVCEQGQNLLYRLRQNTTVIDLAHMFKSDELEALQPAVLRRAHTVRQRYTHDSCVLLELPTTVRAIYWNSTRPCSFLVYDLSYLPLYVSSPLATQWQRVNRLVLNVLYNPDLRILPAARIRYFDNVAAPREMVLILQRFGNAQSHTSNTSYRPLGMLHDFVTYFAAKCSSMKSIEIVGLDLVPNHILCLPEGTDRVEKETTFFEAVRLDHGRRPAPPGDVNIKFASLDEYKSRIGAREFAILSMGSMTWDEPVYST